MNLIFYNKINLKKEKLNKIYFLIKLNNVFYFPEFQNSCEFFSLDIPETDNLNDFLQKELAAFDDYILSNITYFKIEEKELSSLYLIELKKNNSFILDNFISLETLIPKKHFENSALFQKLFRKYILSEKLYYIYILRCKDFSLYTGITTDFPKRLKEHEQGTGAKYTKKKGPFVLHSLYSIKSRSQASKVEAFIKKLPKEKKEKLLTDSTILLKVFPDITIPKF